MSHQKSAVESDDGELLRYSRLIKECINNRRLEDGFKQRVPQEWWEIAVIKRLIREANKYLMEHACAAEIDLLRSDPRPDDSQLEEKLHRIGVELNGLISIDGPPIHRQVASPPHRNRVSRTERDSQSASDIQRREIQEVYENAASCYLHWLLRDNDWVKEFRSNFIQPLTEKEMIELFSSPLSQVLSFADFQELGINPLGAVGTILETIPRGDAVNFPVTKAQRAFAYFRGIDDGIEPICDITLRIEKPDGGRVETTVRRTGKPDRKNYTLQSLHRHFDYVSRLAAKADLERLRSEFEGFGEPSAGFDDIDRDRYPYFPRFAFDAYRHSIVDEAYALAHTLWEDCYYSDQQMALLFVMTGYYLPMKGLSSGTSYFQRRPDYGHHTMTIPPWALPEEVADLWRQVRPKGARERRLPTKEQVALFVYVLQNTRPGGETPWATLARSWEREHAGERMSRDKLYRTYQSVRAALDP